MSYLELLLGGKKVNNYIEDATDNAATNAKWTSTTAQEYTVPVNKRWFLLYGNVLRDASSTCRIAIYDASDDIIGHLGMYAAAADFAPFPCQATATFSMAAGLIILDAGEYVGITCGSAQGSGAYATCVVIEVDML